VKSLSGSRTQGEGLSERRLFSGILCVVAVWLVLLARLAYLQLLQGEEFRLSAERNSVRTHRLEAPRGIIYDRHLEILADSRPSFDVLVVPHETDDLDRTLERVAHLAGLGPASVRERIGRPRGRARFQALRAGTDLGRDAVVRVEARLWSLDGVLTQVSPLRDYPYGDSAAHLLGSLGEIDRARLGRRRFAGYRPGDVIGRQGIEALLDRQLRGRPGGVNVLVDAHGRELERLDELEPEPGNNVVLTLVHALQIAAERGLDETGRSGAVVALDPRDGSVLALVSRPAFDPNLFAVGIDRGSWNALIEDPLRPLQNRALQGQYPPGSTYKVVTAIAALEEGVITPDTRVHCSGSYRLGRRRYRCWRRGGHGEVDVHRALVESCDVFFYQAARAVGIDRLAYYARELGLGRPTGLELGPEAAGLVPTSEWKLRRFGERWIEGETLSAGIGQGFNLWTPIQLAHVYATLANGGQRRRPWIVREIRSPEGEVLEARQPEAGQEIAISRETLEIVRRGLLGVVQEQHGTGYVMRRLPGGVLAAGKTGTAQVISTVLPEPEEGEEVPVELRDHAWFATYAPAEAPEIVVGVLVEHGGHGGSAAAPIARRVVEAYLAGREGGPQLARR
jgi:penicillin-binding protein 2